MAVDSTEATPMEVGGDAVTATASPTTTTTEAPLSSSSGGGGGGGATGNAAMPMNNGDPQVVILD